MTAIPLIAERKEIMKQTEEEKDLLLAAAIEKIKKEGVKTSSDVDALIQTLARRICREYGLRKSDFRIRYFPWRRHAARTRKLGTVVAIYFGVLPFEPEFEFYLRQSLEMASKIVHGRAPKIELVSRLEARKVKDKNWDSLPKLIPLNELNFEEKYVIIVTHKATGLQVAEESYKLQISKMRLEGRIKLTEMVNAVELLKFKEKMEALQIANEVVSENATNREQVVENVAERIEEQ